MLQKQFLCHRLNQCRTDKNRFQAFFAVSPPNGHKKAEQTSNCILCTVCIRSFVKWKRINKKIKKQFLVFLQPSNHFCRKWPTNLKKTRNWHLSVSCPFKKLASLLRNLCVFYNYSTNLSISKRYKKRNLYLEYYMLYNGKEHSIPTLPAQNHSLSTLQPATPPNLKLNTNNVNIALN